MTNLYFLGAKNLAIVLANRRRHLCWALQSLYPIAEIYHGFFDIFGCLWFKLIPMLRLGLTFITFLGTSCAWLVCSLCLFVVLCEFPRVVLMIVYFQHPMDMIISSYSSYFGCFRLIELTGRNFKLKCVFV